jgi:hypothetical protein
MRILSALLVSGVFLAACSSSSGSSGGGSAGAGAGAGSGGGGATLGGGLNYPSDVGGVNASCGGAASNDKPTQACVDCQVGKCKAQLQAAIGTNPNSFGGACATFYACICACNPSDDTCAFGCASRADAACQAANKAVGDCLDANCNGVCN